jgi:hypothetical protein
MNRLSSRQITVIFTQAKTLAEMRSVLDLCTQRSAAHSIDNESNFQKTEQLIKCLGESSTKVTTRLGSLKTRP